MNFSALLFCQDEKTARVTTQLLNELEFSVETQTEPFAAVKKLMGQHFDAVVVDCANEQNASLLFKGARNSQLNQSSLAVAVVEGQAGVANAFRIGANLVLTKPINVEQAKGTLRVARGLLKKGGENKTSAPAPTATAAPAPVASASEPATKPVAAAPAPAPKPPAPRPAAPVSKPAPTVPPAKAMAAPVRSKQSTDNVLDVDADATEPAEEILLDLDEQKPSAKPELKPSMKPSSLLEVEQVASKPTAQRPTTAPVISSKGAASAPAPAKIPAKAPEFEKIGDVASKPQFAAAAPSVASKEAPGLFSQRLSAPTFGGLDAAEPESSGGVAKYAVISTVIAVLAVGGYFGYTKFHKQTSEPAPHAEQVVAPVASPEVTPSAIVTPEPVTAPKPKDSAPEKPSAEVSASSVHKSETSTSESEKAAETEPEVVVKNFEGPRVVKANPTSGKKKVKETEVEAPSAIGATPQDQSALSNIVSSAPVNVPSAAPAVEMLKVSQGVTQGMLLKRVQPVYPRSAIQMRIAGSVQLLAVISKTGNIASIKVLNGDPILAKAAVDAAKQWQYKPYMLDGEAVDIQTQITVNFRLP